MTRTTLALVTAAHLALLLLWHGVAAAGEALQAPTTQCGCVSCDLDANGKGSTFADWQVLFNGFGRGVKQDGYSPRADFNRNGTLDGEDWSTMVACCKPPQSGN